MTTRKSQPNQSSKQLSKIDVDKLAQSWCELLLGQIQEAHNQQKLTRAIEAKTIENIDIT